MSRYDNSEVENVEAEAEDTSKSNTVEKILMRQGSYSRKNLVDFLRRHLPMLEPTQIHGLAGYLDAWYEASLQRQLQEAVNDLADDDRADSADVANPQEKEFKQAIKDNIKASKRLAEVASINTDELENLILAALQDEDNSLSYCKESGRCDAGDIFDPGRGEYGSHILYAHQVKSLKAALESIIKTKELEARIEELERLLRRRDCQRPRCEVEHTYLTKLHTEKRLASLRKELKDGV